jgi:hypothetical protein
MFMRFIEASFQLNVHVLAKRRQRMFMSLGMNDGGYTLGQ